MSSAVNALLFMIELVAGVFAMVLLGEMAGKLFNLRITQKIKLSIIMYVGLVVILLKA